MPAGIGLTDQQLRFVRLVAAGELSIVECHRVAGYSGDTANSSKLARRLASEIAVERERLGISDPNAEVPVIDDADKAALIVEQRRLYALALERGETGLAQKCLRSIERLMKRPGKSGRPTAEKEALAEPTHAPIGSGRPVAELIDMLLTDEDLSEIAEANPPHITEAWLRWRQGGPSSEYLRIAYGEHIAEEPSDPTDLMTTTSHAALTQADAVRRL